MEKIIWICDGCGKTGEAENANLCYDEADWADLRVKLERKNRIGEVNIEKLLCTECTNAFIKNLDVLIHGKRR